MKKRAKQLKKYFRRRHGKEVLEINEIIQKDLDKALIRAQLMLSLEGENVSKPIVIKSANFDNEKISYRVVKDADPQRIDYSESVVTTIYLGTTGMFYHEAVVNHIHGYVVEDYASEIKYRDIVHTELFIDYHTRINDVGVSSLYLLLHLVNGTEISLNLRHHYMNSVKDYPELLTDNEKAVVESIQKAIRAVK